MRKRLKGSTVNFAHTFLTDCAQSRGHVFPNNELFMFYCNKSASFESVFCMKTVKNRLLRKYLERRKSRARFCLSLGWLHISEKKMKNCNFVDTGAQNIGIVVSFLPNFDPNFTDIWRA